MFRRWWLSGCIVLGCGILAAPWALADAPKIGFVDLDKALRELPEAQVGAKALNSLIAEKEKAIEQKQQQIVAAQKSLEEDFPKLNNTERQKREAQLQGMVLDLQKLRQSAQDQVNLQRNQILENIQARLVRVVSEIGKKGHYTLILNDKSVLYVSGAIDLTHQVVAAMEKPKAGGQK
ncbi:OmpH family outer membrane protein [Acidithiobacillus sp. CV18-2]|uniref:OmpH family outer membrane protein n=1 Tax=Igneacidithiobacillus copahuensis TaxID=2724909 RepID=A0AAE3CKI2_9PROT|nr:OmpH family outer membrane protein [Igneacidithiobacillus copahuensis]MBU2753503.1 OmpH family outer membrane protein [Acidithiobacillus sp. CV18-3]MBU2757121.1 OmpH family outer membrane protein [Acidithiobacillus sp. BN09-2]MBU2775997.1 OmpH family outer membrane protein [Acidithiobacillus sp. CV18-2]MBU2795888.1 OmpH family outer membrane protein [Acidithiobacillus sp. VAN18-2]MBU2800326.1 OmpH family outer membrane protein [Acidithiobacillus sp. VAN18-4]UTV79855.1 OmpH family outer mem